MKTFPEKAQQYLDVLTRQIPSRAVGSAGNREATRFFADRIGEFGYQVETPEFTCTHWEGYDAECECAGRKFDVSPSPYSIGCEVTAPLYVVSTLSELQSVRCKDAVLLIRGDLAVEQLMPKNFTFYNPEAHQLIIGLLEEKTPTALITATSRNPELAGAVYPFPLIEDGDFDIPSVYTTDEVGVALANLAGETIALTSMAKRIPSTGCNVIGRINPDAGKKVVVCAHIDAKIGTPGALDNAAGVVTLLLVAEMLKGYSGEYGIELLAMNGEDYYGANGEKSYLANNEGSLVRIRLFINMDGLGYIRGKTAFSFYNLGEEMISQIRPILTRYQGVYEGEPWYQGDHMIVVMSGVPAIAATTEHFMEMEQLFAHTLKDVAELVDTSKLVEAAQSICEVIVNI